MLSDLQGFTNKHSISRLDEKSLLLSYRNVTSFSGLYRNAPILSPECDLIKNDLTDKKLFSSRNNLVRFRFK